MYCVCSIELKGNMHMKKLLLVEDLPEKADEIKKEILKEFPALLIVEKSSYHSAIEEIYRHYNDYFLIPNCINILIHCRKC